MSTRDARPARAGKVRKKCGKNVFYITCKHHFCMREKCFLPHRPAPAGSRWRGAGGKGTAWRPKSNALRAKAWPAANGNGLRPARPAGRTSNALAGDHAPQSRSRTMAQPRQIVHRNQAAVAGPVRCWLARDPAAHVAAACCLLPGSCSLLWLLPGSGSGSCSAGDFRAAQGSPAAGTAAGAKRTWAAHFMG